VTPVLSFALSVALPCFAVAIALAMIRLLRGPSAQDRILALDFISVNAMLIVLVLGIRHGSTMYFEAALLMTLFGFVSLTAMAKFLFRGEVIE
jgi:multicomponent K+:H+ antiporter subunit F